MDYWRRELRRGIQTAVGDRVALLSLLYWEDIHFFSGLPRKKILAKRQVRFVKND